MDFGVISGSKEGREFNKNDDDFRNDFYKEIGGFGDPRDPVRGVGFQGSGSDKGIQRPPGPPRRSRRSSSVISVSAA